MSRRDSWTEENDYLLAQTVLDCIRNGKTQLQAFEEVGNILGRTSAACGFRWNSEVRKQYEEELKQAKAGKKTVARQEVTPKSESTVTKEPEREVEVSVSSVDILESLVNVVNEIVAAVKTMQRENEKLKKENVNLKKKLEDRPNPEDLSALMQLIEKARQIGVLSERNPA
jgi:prespore-specific regulator